MNQNDDGLKWQRQTTGVKQKTCIEAVLVKAWRLDLVHYVFSLQRCFEKLSTFWNTGMFLLHLQGAKDGRNIQSTLAT